MVRCPECGSHFTVSADLTPPPAAPPGITVTSPPVSTSFIPQPEPIPDPPTNRLATPAFLAAVIGAILLGSGLIAGAIVLALNRPAGVATIDPNPQAGKDDAENKRLEGVRQQIEKLEGQRQQLERKQEVLRLVGEGNQALSRKDLDAAEKAFEAALKLVPDDEAALKGMVEVKSQRVVAASGREEEAARRARLEKILADARKARADKQLLVAVRAYEEARLLAPGDETVRKELAAAQDELDADKAEKKKQADYQAALDAGKAHLAAGRFAEAIREFMAAQRVVPNDPEAVRGQKAAEAKIAGLADRDKREAAFTAALDRAKQALSARRYKEALDEATAALRLFPDDERARRLSRDAKDAFEKAKSDYTQLLQQARTAQALGRLEEAYRLFSDAAKIMPEDKEAAKGQADAERAVENIRLTRIAYQRYIDQAILAEQAGRWADAVAAYNEALRLIPADAAATLALEKAQRRVNRLVNRTVNYDKYMSAGNKALATRQYGDAVRYFTDALRALPDDPQAAAGLSKARYERFMEEGKRALGANRKAEAIKAFEGALDEKPGDAQATSYLRRLRGK
jgi:tetratricopeptide (TPR) repeat protein